MLSSWPQHHDDGRTASHQPGALPSLAGREPLAVLSVPQRAERLD
jgi:hypothetical protein